MILDTPIYKTGIRNDEKIAGIQGAKQTSGVVMQVKGFYPPNTKAVKDLLPSEIQAKIELIPFFRGKDVNTILTWLLENSDERELHIHDIPGMRVKFLSISGKNFFVDKLGQDGVNILLAGNPQDDEGYWDIIDVYNMFPTKPGKSTTSSKTRNPVNQSRRNTLVFRGNNWGLFIDTKRVESYSGFYFDLDEGYFGYGDVVQSQEGRIYTYDLNGTNIAAVVRGFRKDKLNEDYLFSLVGNYLSLDGVEDFIHIRESISWFSPSTHKSLIQKVIRTRCEYITHGERRFDARLVLVTSFLMLLIHPGSFVPNIRKYITGLESATKRLAVSIVEDSYTEDKEGLLSLLIASLVSREDRSWQPSDELILRWVRMAVFSQSDERMFVYETSVPTYISQVYGNSVLAFLYLCLSEIGSFEADVNLFHHIAINEGKSRITNHERPVFIPIIHCIDHHTNTELAHYLNYPLTYGNYLDTFKEVWIQSSGFNPRNPQYSGYAGVIDDQPFVKELRNAQTCIWTARSNQPRIKRPILDTPSSVFIYELDESWLAGMIGPIEVTVGNIKAIVVLDTKNPSKMNAIKKPTRDNTNQTTRKTEKIQQTELTEHKKRRKDHQKSSAILTDEQESEAISTARRILERGMILQNVPNTLGIFKNVTVYLMDDTYHLEIDGRLIDWNRARILEYSLPYHPSLDNYDILNSLIYTGEGVDQDAGMFDSIFTNYDLPVLKRLVVYTSSHSSRIELNKISRDGKSVHYQVSPEDTGVSHVLSFISLVYPAAMVRDATGFLVKNGPLAWVIFDVIRRKVRELSTLSQSSSYNEITSGWITPTPDTRPPWEHQTTALTEMIDRHNRGKKGNIIWIPVGTGKTMIVIDYIDYLIKNREMPKYCVYTLPASAIDNIVTEFVRRGMDVKLLDARMNSSINAKTISPYVVNLIKHDHMRLNRMDEKLRLLASEMLFIVDEFHKTLSETIRTSITLELIELSYDFIGMSGTIIKDTHHEELIKWLEKIVDFEVTENNYWVAVGAMTSRRVDTGIQVERYPILVHMTQEQESIYRSMIPTKLGGTSGDMNFQSVVNYCYGIVTGEMVRTILFYLTDGESGVFVVAKDINHQKQIQSALISVGLHENEVFLFRKDDQLTLTPEYNGPIRVVITTPRHSEGYTLTKFRVMIESVYFTNQATREQLEGRINRLNQLSPVIIIITFHTGILTNIYERYENVRSLAEALKGFADDIGFEYDQLS